MVGHPSVRQRLDLISKWIGVARKKYFSVPLTPSEAATLVAFGEISEAYLPELASKARLTGSEITNAVKLLKRRRFVEALGNDPNCLQLTKAGKAARLRWYSKSQQDGTSTSSVEDKDISLDMEIKIKRAIQNIGDN